MIPVERTTDCVVCTHIPNRPIRGRILTTEFNDFDLRKETMPELDCLELYHDVRRSQEWLEVVDAFLESLDTIVVDSGGERSLGGLCQHDLWGVVNRFLPKIVQFDLFLQKRKPELCQLEPDLHPFLVWAFRDLAESYGSQCAVLDLPSLGNIDLYNTQNIYHAAVATID